jgi:hypothetical protein
MLREMQMLPILLLLLYQGKDAVMDNVPKKSHDSHQHTQSILGNHQSPYK